MTFPGPSVKRDVGKIGGGGEEKNRMFRKLLANNYLVANLSPNSFIGSHLGWFSGWGWAASETTNLLESPPSIWKGGNNQCTGKTRRSFPAEGMVGLHWPPLYCCTGWVCTSVSISYAATMYLFEQLLGRAGDGVERFLIIKVLVSIGVSSSWCATRSHTAPCRTMATGHPRTSAINTKHVVGRV